MDDIRAITDFKIVPYVRPSSSLLLVSDGYRATPSTMPLLMNSLVSTDLMNAQAMLTNCAPYTN
jgi:hypothetical protein